MLPHAPSLAPDAPIDLQLHTTHSDGEWTPEALLDHLAGAGFALVAITDHDRADTGADLRRLGAERGVAVLAAAELSAQWEGLMLDLLCFGFDPHDPGPLGPLAETIRRTQIAVIRETYAELLRRGFRFPAARDLLRYPDGEPRQAHELIALMHHHGYGDRLRHTLHGAGFRFVGENPAAILDAAHRSGAVCIVAHPGRGDGFVSLDEPQLARLRAAVPFDGLETHHPSHTPAQVAFYRDYVRRHDLLASTGSDSHGPAGQPPIKYPAALSRDLLERVGIQVR